MDYNLFYNTLIHFKLFILLNKDLNYIIDMIKLLYLNYLHILFFYLNFHYFYLQFILINLYLNQL